MRSLLLGAVAVLTTIAPAAEFELYPSGPGAATNTRVLVRFPCCGELNPNPVTLLAGTQPVSGRSEYLGSEWLLFTPAQLLTPDTSYTVRVAISHRPTFSGSFTTGSSRDVTPPVLVSTSPSAASDDVAALQHPIQMQFSEPLNPAVLRTALPAVKTLAAGSTTPYGTTVTLSTARTISITAPLTAGEVYRVHFPVGLPEDLAGNKIQAPGPDFLFTTYPEAPKDGAQIRATLPADSDANVPTNASIFLAFDRPVPAPEERAFSLSSDADPEVALTVEAITARNSLILRPKALLRPNRRYTLRVRQLTDSFGAAAAPGFTMSFSTGLLPDTRALSAVSVPRPVMPSVRRVRWQYSKPLNPWMLPRLSSVAGDLEIRLLEDGATIEADIPGPGEYVLSGVAYDRIESKPFPLGASPFTVTSVPDDRPPSVLATFPPDQSSGVPPNVSPVVIFDEPLETLQSGQMTLWKGAERVSADSSASDTRYTLRPRMQLDDGAEYRVELRSPADLAGNTAPDVTWSFRVDASKPAGEFRVLQSDPAPESFDVSPTSTISVTFSRPPNPSTLNAGCTSVGGGSEIMAGRWRLEGDRATFEPEFRLPGQSRIYVNLCGVTDFRGDALAAQQREFAFWTAPDPEPPPPFRVETVWPSADESGFIGDGAIVIQFNQPVAPSTLGNNFVTLLGPDGRYTQPRVNYDARTRRLTLGSDVEGLLVLTATSAVRSITGAALEPFSTTVRLRRRTLLYASSPQPVEPRFVASVVPNSNTPAARSNPVIVVYFTRPMDRALVESGLRVLAKGATVNGQIEWSPDSRALTFLPSAPLPASSTVQVLLSLVPWGRAGAETATFSTADPERRPAARWNLVEPFASIPTDGVLDLEFESDQPDGFVSSARAVPGGNAAPIALAVSRLSPSRFRLRPAQPFPPKLTFRIEVITTGAEMPAAIATTYTFETPRSRQVSFGPTQDMGDVPLNALIWLQCRTLLNPLTIRPKLAIRGGPVEFTTEVLDGGFLVLLRPRGLLRGYSVYEVTLTGLEDQAGRPMPDLAWSFRTGAGPDFTPTAAQSAAPSGIADTNAIPRVTFNHPVFFRRQRIQSYEITDPSDFSFYSSSATVTGDVGFSKDGRSLSYFPNRPWPVNTVIGLPINNEYYRDWVDAPVTATTGLQFRTATDNSPAALPAIVNPPPDSEQVPRNAQIQAKFSSGIPEGGAIRLERDGNDVPVTVMRAPDGRTVTIVPKSLLDPETTYTAAAGDLCWSFRTGQGTATEPPQALPAPVWDAEPYFRVLLPVPVNPVSVDSANIEVRAGESRVAAVVTLDATVPQLIVKPQAPLPSAGFYRIVVDGLRDWAGFPIAVRSSSFFAGVRSDTQPPQLQAILPGADPPAAWNTRPAAVFDEPVYLRYGTAGVQVSSGGVPVAVNLQQSSPNVLSIYPVAEWRPGNTYDLVITGILDYNGNEAPPVRSSFTIASDRVPDSTGPRVISTSPAQSAAGVPVDAPVIFEYSKAVYAISDVSSATADSRPVPVRINNQGSRVRVEPLSQWPAGRRISVQLQVHDAVTRRLTTYLSFSTAAVADAQPPEVEAIAPPPGSTLLAGFTDFVIRFNEPVQAGGDWARFSFAGQSTSLTATYPVNGDGRTIIAAANLPSGMRGSLELRSGLTDLSGNALVPVAFEYATAAANESTTPRVQSMQPAGNSSGVPLSAEIQLCFNQPMNQASLEAALLVVNDGYRVPVTLAPEQGGAVWRVVPAVPWCPGTKVIVEVSTAAFSLAGYPLATPFSAEFQTAANAVAPQLAFIETSADQIDLGFSGPLTDLPSEPFGLRTEHDRVATAVERIASAVVRVTPDQPLDPTRKYYLMAGPEREIPIQISREQRRLHGASDVQAPVLGTDERGRFVLQFEAPVPRASLDRGTVAVLDSAGRPIVHELTLEDRGLRLVIQPLSGSRIRVVLWRGKPLVLPQ